jgi:hypothetical protein
MGVSARPALRTACQRDKPGRRRTSPCRDPAERPGRSSAQRAGLRNFMATARSSLVHPSANLSFDASGSCCPTASETHCRGHFCDTRGSAAKKKHLTLTSQGIPRFYLLHTYNTWLPRRPLACYTQRHGDMQMAMR